MVLPLIAWVGITAIGSALTGGMLAKSNSGDSASFGGSLKKEQNSYQYTNNTSETTTNTMNFQPISNFTPNYSFNPMTAVGSGTFDLTKKEAYSTALNPSWDTPVGVATTTTATPTSSQSMGGGSTDLMDSIKQYAFLGAVGFIAYKMLVKEKK